VLLENGVTKSPPPFFVGYKCFL